MLTEKFVNEKGKLVTIKIMSSRKNAKEKSYRIYINHDFGEGKFEDMVLQLSPIEFGKLKDNILKSLDSEHRM